MKKCRDLVKNVAAPLVAVQRPNMGPKGEAKDTVATSPKEVHIIIRRVYGKIYKANCEDQNETTRNYIERYGKYLFKGKTAMITPLTGRDLQITAGELRESAAGLDNWAPAELKQLPIEAYEQLAVLLNMVEAGGTVAGGHDTSQGRLPRQRPWR